MLRDDDDDDEDVKDPHPLREIGVAVAIAGLTALVTKLVDWGLDELRERYSPKKPLPPPEQPPAKPPAV